MCVLESLLFRAKGAARDDGRPAGRRGTENARRDKTERGARRRARRTEGSGRRDVFKDADAGRQA